MSVRVRYQVNTDKSETPWLDCVYKKKRKAVFLDLRIPAGAKKQARDRVEQQAQALADAKWRAIIATGNIDAGAKDTTDFIAYFEKTITKHKKERQWKSVLRLLYLYALEHHVDAITFDDVATQDWHASFKEFLVEHVAQSTAANYYQKIIGCLEIAVEEGHLATNVARKKGIKGVDFLTIYLLPEEITLLANTPEPDRDHVKNAFLFAVYTGLRISDVRRLRWSNIVRIPDEHGVQQYYLDFRMKKGKKNVHLAMNPVALKFIGKRGQADELVFELYDEKTMNRDLRKWCSAAGIEKNVVDDEGKVIPYPIHFHTARHTFACLHILDGTSIYELRDLLGHGHVATTERYAKVMDRGMRRAADNLKDYTVATPQKVSV